MTRIVNGVIVKDSSNASFEVVDAAQKFGGSNLIMIVVAFALVIIFGFKGFGIAAIGFVAYKIFFEHSSTNITSASVSTFIIIINNYFEIYCFVFPSNQQSNRSTKIKGLSDLPKPQQSC